MTNVQVMGADHLRDAAQAVAASVGMDLATAVRIFLTQMVRENGVPFKPASGSRLPFDALALSSYSEKNEFTMSHMVALHQ